MGYLLPDSFISLTESTGFIVELDRFVMHRAMTYTVQWYKDGLNPGVLAINLDIKQLERDDFISTLKQLLKKTGCKAEWIELEVSETQVMRQPEKVIEALKKIYSMGIKLAIDDFGTGYSSLAYLKNCP